MKNTFKAHPLTIYYFIKPYSFVFILPVLKGLIQYIFYREITGVLFLELVLLTGLLLLALLRLFAFKVHFEEETLTIKRGFFIRQTSTINKRYISSVEISRDPLDLLFGSARIRINTEAGRRNSPDFQLKMKYKDAQRLYFLLYGEDITIKNKFSPVKVALMSAATSSAGTGLLIGVPVINQIGRTLGVSLADMLFYELNTVSHKINTYTPPVVNLITLIALVAYSFSFLVSFFRNVGFSLGQNGGKIEIRSGFFTKRQTVFKKESINNVCIEQNPVMRLFHVFSLRASVAGYGCGRNERALLMPCAPENEIKEMFRTCFSTLSPDGSYLKAPHNYRNGRRFLYVPTLLAVIVIALAILEGVFFPELISPILFANSVLLVLVVYYGNISVKSYRQGKISFGDNVTAQGGHGLSYRKLYCKKEKIGVIKITRTPADLKYDTCKVKLTVCSESADSIRIKNISYPSLCRNVENCYGIDGIYCEKG